MPNKWNSRLTEGVGQTVTRYRNERGEIKREINEKMDTQVRFRHRPYNHSIFDTFEKTMNEFKTNL